MDGGNERWPCLRATFLAVVGPDKELLSKTGRKRVAKAAAHALAKNCEDVNLSNEYGNFACSDSWFEKLPTQNSNNSETADSHRLEMISCAMVNDPDLIDPEKMEKLIIVSARLTIVLATNILATNSYHHQQPLEYSLRANALFTMAHKAINSNLELYSEQDVPSPDAVPPIRKRKAVSDTDTIQSSMQNSVASDMTRFPFSSSTFSMHASLVSDTTGFPSSNSSCTCMTCSSLVRDLRHLPAIEDWTLLPPNNQLPFSTKEWF